MEKTAQVARDESHHRGKPPYTGKMTILKRADECVEITITQIRSPNETLRIVSEFLSEH